MAKLTVGIRLTRERIALECYKVLTRELQAEVELPEWERSVDLDVVVGIMTQLLEDAEAPDD